MLVYTYKDTIIGTMCAISITTSANVQKHNLVFHDLYDSCTWQTVTLNKNNLILVLYGGTNLWSFLRKVALLLVFYLRWVGDATPGTSIWSFLIIIAKVALLVKNPPANAGDIRDTGLIPGSGRYPGDSHGNPFQYSCLENLMDRQSLSGYHP